ncbi:type I restriction-modification system subunit M N-terminal domain-containing protein [Actinomadura sp. KC06]|uniref:type I restriction-modification system subunit M N-terminal domain-containing protein n=1 Tax=Actinomadura sp. KC06 TaxID=2530369 RepID=UPI0026839856
MSVDQNLSAFIWSVADLLRGDYKQSEYGKVILPFTVLRRFDCVMEPTRQAVWERDAAYPGDTPPALLKGRAGPRPGGLRGLGDRYPGWTVRPETRVRETDEGLTP